MSRSIKQKEAKFSVGQKVRTKRTASMKAWALAGKRGVIIAGDPRATNPYVRKVRLDEGFSMLESRGVHISHLEVIE